MKFGIVFPSYDSFCNREFAEKLATKAEDEGLDSMLVWDHYMLPYGNRTFDAYILLSYLAGKTESIRLGTCVTPLPFRNPAMLAKMIATLDRLSEGRVIVGVGAGWSRKEFEGYSEWSEDATRVRKTEEALELMTRLWGEKKVTFKGKFYSTKGAILEPGPVQKPHPPLWFGTKGKVMMQLAAKYGTGWIPTDITLREYKKYLSSFGEESILKENFVFSISDCPQASIRWRIEFENMPRPDVNTTVWFLVAKSKKRIDKSKSLGNSRRAFEIGRK